ncbi:ethanolamine utilization protein [Pilibacter termitis]|uniref:Ethanolamine utilization protein n=1 Tax=Pilibacter termitis TaxID=263852 RepID=A0A1T4K5U9_9ENTE|nr:hypothetical protein [Pilibacter termitis]SJZ37804.1 ethanolamine utilization protein [Pilibacter termitis]
MKSEEIEILIQKIVEEVIKRLDIKDTSTNTLCAMLLGDEKNLPEAIFEKITNYLVLSQEISLADMLLVANLTLGQLSALANLQENDEETKTILQALLKKKSVFILSTSFSLKELRSATRFGIWREIGEMMKKLESYGVHFIHSDEEFEKFLYQEELRKKRKHSIARRGSK